MSRNGSGTYNLPAGNPVVSGSVISSTWANNTLSDMAAALTGSVASDGQTPMSGALNMTNNLITNVLDPISNQDAATKNYVDTSIATVEAEIAALNLVKTGTIQMWPTASAPTGYLLCGGSAVSRTTYSDLFAVIGTTFGSGDGSTTFNLPNYTGKFPYGATVGSTGGSADSIVVSHTHTASSSVTDSGHTHSYNINTGTPGSSGYVTAQNPNAAISGTASTNSATTGVTVSTTVDSSGSSGTGANIPPYLGINFIIKV